MLDELCALVGVSGDEHKVRKYIKNTVLNDVQEMIEDAYGNLIVRKGPEDKAAIMFAAHMDEIGFIITGIEKSGFLRFAPIGISPHILSAKKVIIGDNEIHGAITAKPVHLVKKEERKKVPEIEDMYIDIGVSSKEEAVKAVKVGDRGTFYTRFSRNGDRIYGKAFDDRIGCYVLIQLLKNSDFPMYCAFTTQEEVGLRGARIVGDRIAVKAAIAVDTTASGEWPLDKDSACYPEIGKGPVLSIADRSVICDQRLVSFLEKTAEQQKISYQYKRPMIGGTDAGPLHVSRDGVRVAVVQTPARYIHSPLSVASMNDIDAQVKLLKAFLERWGKEEGLWN